MWMKLILLVFVSAATSVTNNSDTSVSDAILFRKCCERNQVLVKFIDMDLSLLEHYECVSTDYIIDNFNRTATPLIVSESIVVQASLPSYCEDLEINELNIPNSELYVSESECYDRLEAEIVNGSLTENIPKSVSLSCNKSDVVNGSQTDLKINRFIKCCPQGQEYDIEYHQCRHSNKNNNKSLLIDYLKLNKKYIYEQEIGLRCKFDEYAVALRESLFQFAIDGSDLEIKNKNDGATRKFMQGEWCLENRYGGQELIAQVCTRDCAGFEAFCIRKCCPQGEHFHVTKCGSFISVCQPNTDNGTWFDISSYTNPLRIYNKNLFDVMGVRTALQCPAGRFALNKSLELDQHSLTPQANLQLIWTTTNNFCLEIFDSRHCPSKDIFSSAVMCFQPAPENRPEKDFRFSFVIIMISNVCLALTLIVYCALPELRNLNGRNLICHVSMMLLAFSCLARVQYNAVTDIRTCTFLGYGIYFGFVAAFAWLNVMCFDIWWTFGSVRTVKLLHKSSSERRRFIWYSVYAWGSTLVLTLTMFLLDHYPVSIYLDANIGTGACWFSALQNTATDWPHYIFFVVPMGLVTCTNFILWLLTARYCAKVKSEVHRLQAGSVGERVKKRFRVDRAKYILTGKLWVVMGAGWVSELVSTLVSDPQWLWNIVDLINELQGVLIFLILVVKPKLYYILRKRLGLDKAKDQQNTTSGRTSSTFLSRTISSDERTNLKTAVTPPSKMM